MFGDLLQAPLFRLVVVGSQRGVHGGQLVNQTQEHHWNSQRTDRRVAGQLLSSQARVVLTDPVQDQSHHGQRLILHNLAPCNVQCSNRHVVLWSVKIGTGYCGVLKSALCTV